MIKHCYYLNLDRRPDRKEFIEAELSKSKLLSGVVERFPAVDGLKIHPWSVEKGLLTRNAIDDILSETVTAWGLSITQGGLGVILSYKELLTKISEMDSNVVTFEDDIYLNPDFDEKLEVIIKELPEDFDICYLGYGETPIERKEYSQHLSKPLGRIVCLPALIVSPKGARNILSLFKNLDNQIDTAISYNFNKINAFIATEPIVKIKNEHSSDIQGDKNCRKQYLVQNYIFATIALGEVYISRCLSFAQDLKFFNQRLLVVTDTPEAFVGAPNVITVKYDRVRFSYNHKTICFEEGFKLADAVVYIDCDSRLLYKSYKNTMSCFSLVMAPGFHPSWDWGRIARPEGKFFTSGDLRERRPGYGELALKICHELDINYSEALHYQEGIIAVAKQNGKEKIFIDTWKAMANRLDAHEIANGSERIGLGEGNLVGLALAKSGMTINSHDVCNIIGESVKYNFYGQNAFDQMKLAPDRKLVETSQYKELANFVHYVDFRGKSVDLHIAVYEASETMGMVVYKWNTENNVELLDHEFSVNGTVFHFQSEKTNQFYFDKRKDFSIEHTYDWYGEKKWVKIL